MFGQYLGSCVAEVEKEYTFKVYVLFTGVHSMRIVLVGWHIVSQKRMLQIHIPALQLIFTQPHSQFLFCSRFSHLRSTVKATNSSIHLL